QLAGAKLGVPSAFLTGANDPVNLMSPAAVMDGYVTDHRGTTVVEDAGHWVQQEKPGEVNEAILSFLGGLDLRSPPPRARPPLHDRPNSPGEPQHEQPPTALRRLLRTLP